MDEIIIRNSKGAALFGLFIFVPFTLIGLYLLNKEASFTNWAILLVFGVLSVVCVWMYFDRRPRLVLDSVGIDDKRTKMGVIEWRDITQVSIVSTKNTHHLQLRVVDISKYKSRMGVLQKMGSKIDKVAGLGDLSVNVAGLELTAKPIADIVVERVARARNI